MSKHSVAEAKNKLPELIDRALEGEEVIITRHGRPVAILNPVPPAPKILMDRDLEWLAQRRAGRGSLKKDAGTIVSHMRDEDWR